MIRYVDLSGATFEPAGPTVTIYLCDRCGRTYKRVGPIQTACLVMHLPGECCHYGEQLLDENGETL